MPILSLNVAEDLKSLTELTKSFEIKCVARKIKSIATNTIAFSKLIGKLTQNISTNSKILEKALNISKEE